MGLIAGHAFVNGACGCGILWLNIRNVSHEDCKKDGIAHVGKLQEYEILQIIEARTAEDKAIAAAIAEAGR